MRPRKDPAERRTRETVVLFTNSERERIEVKASLNGRSISGHLRWLALRNLEESPELDSERS